MVLHVSFWPRRTAGKGVRMKPGSEFQIIVGMPGPDIDTGIILSVLEDGSYKTVVSNSWTGEIEERIYPAEKINKEGLPYPGQAAQYLGRLRAYAKAWERE